MKIQKNAQALAKIGGKCVAVLVCFTGVESANALNFQNSTGLTSPVQTITFDEFVFPDNTSITNQYSSLGVTFSPNLFFNNTFSLPNITPNSLENFEAGVGGTRIATFSILFSTDQNEAAFAMVTSSGTSTFTALLDGAVVETFDATTDSTSSNNFYGFTDIVFDEISVSPGGTPNIMALDNLQIGAGSTAVPFEFSPTLGFLLVGGLFGSNYLYQKKKAEKLVFSSKE